MKVIWAIDLDICEPTEVERQAAEYSLTAEYVGTPVQWPVYRLTGSRDHLVRWLSEVYGGLEGPGEALGYLLGFGNPLDNPPPAV